MYSSRQEAETPSAYERRMLPSPFSATFSANGHLWASQNSPLKMINLSWHRSLALSRPTPPSPWWEMEVIKILQSREPNLIVQLLRFRLYGTTEFLRHTLHQLWTINLDNVVSLLQHQEAFHGHREQKVNKIIELAELRLPLPSPVSSWRPRQATNQQPLQIGCDISKESRSMFEKVDFSAWVRYALGYEEDSVQRLFTQHGCISIRIRWYLDRYPMQRPLYIRVMEVGLLRHLKACTY